MKGSSSHHNVWEGVLQEVPMRIELDVELEGLDTLISPVSGLRYSIMLHTTSGDEVLPCSSCINNRITDVISYDNLHIEPSGRKVHIRGTITVRCDGTQAHDSTQEGIITLGVY